MTNKVALIILDGWGYGKGDHTDAIANADTSYFNSLIENYPNSTLKTFGNHVGLPDGQMGNSEVGHLNIGAGRIVQQELSRINNAIEQKDFFGNPTLLKAFANAKTNHKKVHFIGLVSHGGVHSSLGHVYALCKMVKQQQNDNVYIHAFTDGRDCDPKSGLQCMKSLEKIASENGIKIASIIGRYYAMDRDNRWNRIKKCYDLITGGVGEKFNSSDEAILASYSNEITDEFIEPVILDKNGLIQEGDTVICFNFRSDRPREITTALTQKDFPEFGMFKIELDYYCMTRYDEAFENIHVIFDKKNIQNTLGEVLSKAGKSQIRIAETEKYPHVTFFFNGGREAPFTNEDRILVDSPKVATYDLQPEMSAPEVTTRILNHMSESPSDFICLNFANPDMVGHTGVFEAIVKAVTTVDQCLEKIVEHGKKMDYEFIIIADHGNADLAINDDGTVHTAHTLNPVPVVYVSGTSSENIKKGVLADIAPTILHLFGIKQPSEMTGNSLLT